MSLIRDFLARHSLSIGLVLMFALTWPIDLAQAGLLPFEVSFAVSLFLGWGFVTAALVMTSLTLGRAGVSALLRRYLIWRVGWRWYAFALALYPIMFFVALWLSAAWGQEPFDLSRTMAARFFGAPAAWPLFILPYFLFETVANGEEMGWRGYVLPRVQATRGALAAALIVGILWGLWHLPKYIVPFNGTVFALIMVKTIADSVLYSWLYNNTRGSLLLATLFHASGNTAGFFLLPALGEGEGIGALPYIVLLGVLTAAGVALYARAKAWRPFTSNLIQDANNRPARDSAY